MAPWGSHPPPPRRNLSSSFLISKRICKRSESNGRCVRFQPERIVPSRPARHVRVLLTSSANGLNREQTGRSGWLCSRKERRRVVVVDKSASPATPKPLLPFIHLHLAISISPSSSHHRFEPFCASLSWVSRNPEPRFARLSRFARHC